MGKSEKHPRTIGTKKEVRPGVWRLRAVVGYRPDGQPRQASKTVTGTERQAAKALAEFVVEAGNQRVAVGTETFGDFYDRWVEHVTPNVSPATVRAYTQRSIRIKELLGRKQLKKLTVRDLDGAYGQWLRDGLAPETIRGLHNAISACLSTAVRWGEISLSPASRANPPKQKSARRPTIDVATVRQLAAAAARSPVMPTVIALAAVTGARRGELCALRWKDVDFGAGLLHIRQGAKRGLNGGTVLGDTKDHRERTISLDDFALAVLQHHHLMATQWAQDADVPLTGDSFILSREAGGITPLKPDTVSESFYRITRRLGLDELNFHDLRHFSATTLIAAGLDPVTVAHRLGHANPNLTLRIYSHALEARDKDAAEVLGALMAGG